MGMKPGMNLNVLHVYMDHIHAHVFWIVSGQQGFHSPQVCLVSQVQGQVLTLSQLSNRNQGLIIRQKKAMLTRKCLRDWKGRTRDSEDETGNLGRWCKTFETRKGCLQPQGWY
jgi:hypothetical protein